jgi:murein DD-endopeptidase MepM/ murein hydrolase activator NlpD
MNKLIKISAHILLVLSFIYLLFASSAPIQANSDPASPVILTDENFTEVVRGLYGSSIQDILKKNQSPLANYQRKVGDQTLTAGDIFWITSQQEEFFISPKVLLTTYITLYGANQIPTQDLMDINRNIATSLWSNFGAYQNGSRDYHLKNGAMLTIEKDANAATFAVKAYLAQQAASSKDLDPLVQAWTTNFQVLFNQSPAKNAGPKAAPPKIAPFLQLPFTQPVGDFLKVNSFFDHNVPSVFDDSISRLDGNTIGTANFSNCSLGVSCYGGHNAIDYSTGASRPVLAAAAGKVVYRYYNTDASQGYVDSGLIIDHGNGYMTQYWHMDPILVNMGDQVNLGQMVGLSGNIGKSSGAHLHFGLRISDGSKSVDPFGWWGPGVQDVWGDSKWMWAGDQVADNGEAQSQFFYNSYWYYDATGYNGNSVYTGAMSSISKSTNWGIWGAYINTPGIYDVYAYWPKKADNATAVTYRVFSADGVNDVQINQSADGDRWVKLGTYHFNQDSYTVILTDYNKGTGKRVYFDAVQWVKTGDTPAATMPPAATATSVPTATQTPTPVPTIAPTATQTPTSLPTIAPTVNTPTSAPTTAPTVSTPTSIPTTAPTFNAATPVSSAQNLALGKPASQSSNGSIVSPGLAVDGNTDGNYRNNSTTHTLSDMHAWWQVDLGTINSIQSIRLWNRTDCCSERLSNFHVFVSDVPFNSTDLQTTLGQAGVSDYPYSAVVGTNIEINIGRTGRYVRVQLAGTDVLSLAEVQVMGTLSIPAATPATPGIKNDDFGGASVIPESAAWGDQMDTSQATTSTYDPLFSCGKFSLGKGTHSVWYQITPGKAGNLTLSTNGSGYDSVLAVWTGQRGMLTMVGCNDDLNYPSNVQSGLQMNVAAGRTYYVEIVGWGPYSTGNLKFISSFVP